MTDEVRTCRFCPEPATFRFTFQVSMRTDDALDQRGTMILWCHWYVCRICAFKPQTLDWKPTKGQALTHAQIDLRDAN